MSGLKQNKDYAKADILGALRNSGIDDAGQRCAMVLHPVLMWHGRWVFLEAKTSRGAEEGDTMSRVKGCGEE